MSYTYENKIPGATLEEQQEVLLKTYPALRLNDAFRFEQKENPDVKTFVWNFLKIYNSKYDTRECLVNKIHCTPAKRRSLIDIFMITRFYFPNCTIKEVKEAIRTVPNLISIICRDIKRRVYIISYAGVQSIEDSKFLDEFGLTFENYRPEKPVEQPESIVKEVPTSQISNDGTMSYITNSNPYLRW